MQSEKIIYTGTQNSNGLFTKDEMIEALRDYDEYFSKNEILETIKLYMSQKTLLNILNDELGLELLKRTKGLD